MKNLVLNVAVSSLIEAAIVEEEIRKQLPDVVITIECRGPVSKPTSETPPVAIVKRQPPATVTANETSRATNGTGTHGGEQLAFLRPKKKSRVYLRPDQVRDIYGNRNRIPAAECATLWGVSYSTIKRIYDGIHPIQTGKKAKTPRVTGIESPDIG